MSTHARQHFPTGFLWGAATAAHQIEGNNVHSDWWAAEQEGRLPYRSGSACDSWNRWRDDIGLLDKIGLNAYRFSIEWARIEPEPGRFDQQAIDTYRKQVEAMKEAGVEPLVTLHHFTHPLWLEREDGWRTPNIVDRLAVYTDTVARNIGDLITWWVTINEPSILAPKMYLEGAWPPQRPGDLRGYARTLRHAAFAHGAMRQIIKSHNPAARASIAFAIWPLQPVRRWNPIDRAMVRLGDWLWQGRVLRRTQHLLDWVGVNYYSRVRVGWPPERVDAALDPHAGAGDRTDYGWEIYPPGLYDVLMRAGRYGKPVVITENGISDAEDTKRAAYLVSHLQQVQRAIADGVDVRGYMHWSLMDNFEWADGFTQRFGLAHVNFTTFERTLRPSAQVYAEIARANDLPENPLALPR
ncbi:MAG TPA: family 1 glycosylhydrolase [Chloroflexota bacterium]|nr:family 1 glycosylhydrolase [Chloroflexota bacterium]